MFTYGYFFQSKQDHKNICFYERKLFDCVFKFYVDQKRNLSVQYWKNGKKQKALLIKGIPKHYQQNLHDPVRRHQIEKVLDASYFTVTGCCIEVNPRGLGGWGGDVHQDKTKKWLTSLMGEKDAEVIAKADKETDEGETDPAKHCLNPWAQGWHFNCGRGKGGNPDDTRVQHVIDCLEKAIAKRTSSYSIRSHSRRKKKYKSSLETFGMGLHALQDIFAHSDPFIIVNYIFGGCFFSHDIIPNHADNPKFIHHEYSPKSLDARHRRRSYSQRYTNTRDLTIFYAQIYVNHTVWDVSFAHSLIFQVAEALNKQNLYTYSFGFVLKNPVSGLREIPATISTTIEDTKESILETTKLLTDLKPDEIVEDISENIKNRISSPSSSVSDIQPAFSRIGFLDVARYPSTLPHSLLDKVDKSGYGLFPF